MNHTGNVYEKTFIAFYALIPLVDTFNGFLLLNHIPSPVGQAYRIFVMMIFSLFLLKWGDKKSFYKLFIFISFLYILQCVYFYSGQSIKGLKYDFSLVTKLIFIILGIETYRCLYKKELVSRKTIEQILKISLIVFPLTILVPKILGVGFAAYGESGGYSAFYFANNDINIVLIILFVYSLELLFRSIRLRKFKLRYLFGFITMIIVTLLIGSKSSMGLCVLTILVYLFRSLKQNSLVNNMKLFFGIGLSIVVMIQVVSRLFQDQMEGIMERNTYFFMNSSSLLNFLLSSRDVFLQAAIESLIRSEHFLMRFLFGIGPYERNAGIGGLLNIRFKEIEMDFFDVFFAFGLVGTLIIYSYFLSIYLKSGAKTAVGKRYLFAYKYIFIAIMAFSTVVGHVLFSALAGSYLSLICAMLIGGDPDEHTARLKYVSE
ncbi:hypothetical protein EWH99_11015 [Sporolactobacillus sp. THM7-7]|nr:hypothetical protein EWH99_11015 [Sporolactobacillus sp. THM7-7]